MIALTVPARSDAQARFVTRLNTPNDDNDRGAQLIARNGDRRIYSGENGLFELTILDEPFDGDVVVVDPVLGSAERLVRRNSEHNTFLVTERCDQLCVMCSQPPKKTHIGRWEEFRQAALLAPAGKLIGLSGGEPTLYKEDLFALLDEVLEHRPDLSFHVLSNGQHFDDDDLRRLRNPAWHSVAWGIPIYSAEPDKHDAIVAKRGAHARLRASLAVLLEAGAHVELRTVVMSENVSGLPRLAEYVAGHLGFIDQWSIMQLESIGFAQNRFFDLAIDVEKDFPAIATAIDMAELFGIATALFNFPMCTVPAAYRRYAIPSISDWKRKFAPQCTDCSVSAGCSGFFAWHPETAIKVRPL